MDDELRKKGKAAADEGDKQSSIIKSIRLYQTAVESYLAIQNKKEEDFYSLYEVSHSLAIIYFNRNQYKEAAQYYLNSINCLQQTVLNDKAYRYLTARCIDLADAYNALVDYENANKAIMDSIKHFKAIKEKTPEERALGEPTAANFKQYHSYFQLKSSTPSFIASVKFKNDQELLTEEQNKDVLSQASNNSFDEDLESMLQQLSLAAPHHSSHGFFAAALPQGPNDNNYRTSAQNILRLAQRHIKNEDIIETYKQSMAALKLIQQPTQHDLDVIKQLNNKITLIEAKEQDHSRQQNTTVPVPVPILDPDEEENVAMEDVVSVTECCTP